MELADLIVAHRVADPERVGPLATMARERGASLAGVIVDHAVCDEQRLAQLVAREANLPFVDLSAASFEPATLALIPDDFARDRLVVALSFDASGSRLRIAIADPFDSAALEALRALTGAELDVVVATVSALRAILDWDYGARSQVSRKGASGELTAEDTRRIAFRGELAPSGTAPAVRPVDGASAEQRVEALVLALIEAGVITRAAYLEALERLLDRYRAR